MAKTHNRREFLQLAHVYDPKKHTILGWFASEKLDGMRAYWDGGLTRGMYTNTIPFANTAKDGRYLVSPQSTGLWSRYGKPIQAPMWWLDELPPYPLDGELYLGRGKFQTLVSTVKKLNPDDEAWRKVKYMIFDLPDYSKVFMDGTINVPNFEKNFKGILDWAKQQKKMAWTEPKLRRFETVVHLLNEKHSDPGARVQLVRQTRLPFNNNEARDTLEQYMASIINEGGEGVILRNHNSIWHPQRVYDCLKVKPANDCEVTVTGFVWGKQTDRGSKLLGLMGAMIVDFNGKRLEIGTGFTDAERRMVPTKDFVRDESRYDFPGKIANEYWMNPMFPVGSKITIKYRELTDDGLPKEGRYFRLRED